MAPLKEYTNYYNMSVI